jgi:hypothetical protein
MTRELSAARKPAGEHSAERDRHLAEDVAAAALADDALDSVDELDRLDATLEHGEERPLRTLGRRVLTRDEADVRRRTRETVPVLLPERSEGRDPGDLLCSHHA